MRPALFHINTNVVWTITTYDPDKPGVEKDADSNPTVTVRKNGSAVGDSVTVTKRTSTTGIYDCSYNPAGEVEGDTFTIEESVTITGSTSPSATYRYRWAIEAIALERGTDSVTSFPAAAPADWIGASSIAANALNDKGNWLTSLGANAPSGWLNAAAFSAGAFDAVWTVGTRTITGTVTLATSQPNYAPARAGDAMALTPSERTAVATVLEAAMFNEADATALLAAIAAKVEQFLINDGDAVATLAAIASAVNAAVVAGQIGTDLTATKASAATAATQATTAASTASTIDTKIGTPSVSVSADIATRLPTASYTAPDNTGISTINTKLGTPAVSIAADIASRLPTSSYVVPPTPEAIADAVYDEAMAGHTIDGSYGAHFVRAANKNQNEVMITGSKHIAADLHECQTDVIDSTALAASAAVKIRQEMDANSVIFVDLKQMIVNDGTANAQWSAKALELGPSGESTLSQDDISAIAAAVRLLPNVNTGASRTGLQIIQSDRLLQTFSVAPGTYSRLVWSLKRKSTDPDSDALLTVDSADGIVRLNGAAPTVLQEAMGTLSYASGTVTLDVNAEITKLLPVGDSYVDGIKVLPANRHLRNAPASAKVVAGVVQDID